MGSRIFGKNTACSVLCGFSIVTWSKRCSQRKDLLTIPITFREIRTSQIGFLNILKGFPISNSASGQAHVRLASLHPASASCTATGDGDGAGDGDTDAGDGAGAGEPGTFSGQFAVLLVT